MKFNPKKTRPALIASLFAVLIGSPAATAQTASMYGTLANFDVINDTGEETHGFEIEIQGLTGVAGTFTWNRYGAPSIEPYAGGVYVRYKSAWNPAAQVWVTSTPVAINRTPTNGHQCVLGTFNYQTSGCEHFGVWSPANANKVIYRWLIADPNNPGQLIPHPVPVAMVTPVWTVLPPAQPAGQPIVAAEVPAPIPPKPAIEYGDAQWVKVFKSEQKRLVGLDELVADNVVVPQNEAEIETQWDLIQDRVGGNGKRNRHRNQGAIGNGSKAVVRRYETYKFTGTYDPLTHEAICADGLCNAPADSELGDFIGAQNAAGNLNVPDQVRVNVAVTGSGEVRSNVGSIRCPGVCAADLPLDTVITLSAKGVKDVFTGWGGPCQGTAADCTVTLHSSADVTADFKPAAGGGGGGGGTGGGGGGGAAVSFKLVIKVNGKGSVAANPAGTAFPAGTVVSLTATPNAGEPWIGWSGACTGTARTCSVTMNADTTVQANFR